ncbi:MAG: Asp-tRNA(Asn)/Glu-tRNA(Gln) amidotransferase subunit GatA [Patescibacteria group bacterium]|nr:Asp-tRNA(Asn)/Glu-tRNA(Gln) amidotransferase subunit GatA [Patescibacteria group bacterium]
MNQKFTIEQINRDLNTKSISCVDLIRSCIEKIKIDALNDFISIFEDDAIEQAQKIDEKIKSGKKLEFLEGVPVAIKDNILVKNKKCTAASKMLANYIASYDAHVIEKLKNSGVIILGKTNMDEFAMGSSNETSFFGNVLNPHDKTRVPGGSSGGSAASVSANHCVFSLGSDTGGSIRQPASFCGVCGLKPSYGRVSRSGLISLASSLDQIGVIANSVIDCAISFNSICGRDKLDMTSFKSEILDISKIQSDVNNIVVGIPKNFHKFSIDNEILASFDNLIYNLKKAKIKVKEIDMSFMDCALSVYCIIQPAESSANLARYDGFRYGFDSKIYDSLKNAYENNRTIAMGDEVKRRILIGTYVLSSGYKDAYYNKARLVQLDIKNKFNEIFKKVDFILTPTSPSKAFKIGEKIKDPLTMYFSDIFTVSANIAGLPAISIPLKSNDLPIGLQIIGKYMDEENILHLSYNLDKKFINI